MEDKENRSTYEEHDASFDPDPETTLSEDELQDSILADSGMNAFQLYVAKMNDKSWNLAQAAEMIANEIVKNAKEH